MEFLAYLAAILIFAIICMADKLKKFYQEKKIKNWVSWVVVYNTLAVSSHDMPLWMYIHNAQIKLGIDERYRISTDEEWKFAKEIIQEFQNNLMQSYFKGNLGLIKSKYVIYGEDYFMYKLGSFLEEHQCDYEFLGYKMHKERISYKKYGSWGGELFDASYVISDFSVVYHKLYHTVYMFCKNCKSLNENGLRYSNGEFLKEILDTKQIKISRY